MHNAQPVKDRIRERGLLTVPDEVWQLAVRRAEVIGPLAASSSAGSGAVDAAAARQGVSRRQVYVLQRRWRVEVVPGLVVVEVAVPHLSSAVR